MNLLIITNWAMPVLMLGTKQIFATKSSDILWPQAKECRSILFSYVVDRKLIK